MKNTVRKSFVPLALLLALFGATAFANAADESKTDAVERLQSAATALRDVARAPDKGIPDEIFEGAKCVAVVPSMVKGGFIVGGQHGRGVATCRLPNRQWSAPAFFTISGGSFGAQIGVEDVQLVMVVMNDEGMKHMLEDKFKIGANASAAGGPVGRHASANTDWKLDTQILTYSRAKGAFAGVDLGGSWIERDKDTTAAYYGRDIGNRELFDGRVSAPESARVFLNEVARVKTEASEK